MYAYAHISVYVHMYNNYQVNPELINITFLACSCSSVVYRSIILAAKVIQY